MNCELNGMKIKYESAKVWVWREWKSKPPDWCEAKGTIINGYRQVSINKKKYPYHRVVYFIHNENWLIGDTSMNNYIDHIDRDKLNNNIENLRVVTHSHNMCNQDRKGYTFHKARGKYKAQIMVDGKNIHLGLFVNPDDAHQAYLEAKKIYHPPM